MQTTEATADIIRRDRKSMIGDTAMRFQPYHAIRNGESMGDCRICQQGIIDQPFIEDAEDERFYHRLCFDTAAEMALDGIFIAFEYEQAQNRYASLMKKGEA